MDPPLTSTSSKVRLMCSYGGHIAPRPRSKSLFYSGGDTRIVTVPTAFTLSLSALAAHLSSSLRVTTCFTLKYQLPNHDLDSLVSLSTDDDLQIMLEEHHSLSTSPPSSRIRLFLFPLNPNIVAHTELTHPKTESWFVDALRSAKMMQKRETGVGGEGEDSGISLGEGNGITGQESILLEASSSFGSSSSSISSSNLPPIKAHGGGNGAKLTAPDSLTVASDNIAVSQPQTPVCADPFASVALVENKVFSSCFDSDSRLADPSVEVQIHKPVQISEVPLNAEHLSQQHQMQLLHTGTQGVHQNLAPVQPVMSYYPDYHPPTGQHHLRYQYQSYSVPLYYMPVAQAQPYNSDLQCGLLHTSSVSSSMTHTNASVIPSSYQVHYQPQPCGNAACDSASYVEEIDNDPAKIQMYKSQPPPPALPSLYKTMTKGTAVLLSEALAQMHVDHSKQQNGTVEPQLS